MLHRRVYDAAHIDRYTLQIQCLKTCSVHKEVLYLATHLLVVDLAITDGYNLVYGCVHTQRSTDTYKYILYIQIWLKRII